MGDTYHVMCVDGRRLPERAAVRKSDGARVAAIVCKYGDHAHIIAPSPRGESLASEVLVAQEGVVQVHTPSEWVGLTHAPRGSTVVILSISLRELIEVIPGPRFREQYTLLGKDAPLVDPADAPEPEKRVSYRLRYGTAGAAGDWIWMPEKSWRSLTLRSGAKGAGRFRAVRCKYVPMSLVESPGGRVIEITVDGLYAIFHDQPDDTSICELLPLGEMDAKYKEA